MVGVRKFVQIVMNVYFNDLSSTSFKLHFCQTNKWLHNYNLAPLIHCIRKKKKKKHYKHLTNAEEGTSLRVILN